MCTTYGVAPSILEKFFLQCLLKRRTEVENFNCLFFIIRLTGDGSVCFYPILLKFSATTHSNVSMYCFSLRCVFCGYLLRYTILTSCCSLSVLYCKLWFLAILRNDFKCLRNFPPSSIAHAIIYILVALVK